VIATLRRLVAVLLLAVPCLSTGAALGSLSRAEGCTDHVCFCKMRPAAAGESCHGDHEAPSAAMTGSCHHERTDPVLPATTPGLLPAAPSLAAFDDRGAPVAADSRDSAPGHRRLPLQPPRAV
jgi:hypothetical protein